MLHIKFVIINFEIINKYRQGNKREKGTNNSCGRNLEREE
jgi:hypothetical protein